MTVIDKEHKLFMLIKYSPQVEKKVEVLFINNETYYCYDEGFGAIRNFWDEHIINKEEKEL